MRLAFASRPSKQNPLPKSIRGLGRIARQEKKSAVREGRRNESSLTLRERRLLEDSDY